MIASIPTLRRRRSLRVIGVYFAAGGWSGLAFYYIAHLPALESILFQPVEKFLIPTYWYWALLGASLLVAIATGWAISLVAGWHDRQQIGWFRYLLASILVAASVPFQAWLFNSRQQVNEDFRAWDSNDLYVVAGIWAIAIVVYSIGLVTKAPWPRRLAMSLFLIAVLAVWPTGVFALFIALAAYVVTGRLEVKFALALLVAVILGLAAGGLLCHLVGLPSIWPLAIASVNALCGYQLYRASSNAPELVAAQTNTALIRSRCSG